MTYIDKLKKVLSNECYTSNYFTYDFCSRNTGIKQKRLIALNRYLNIKRICWVLMSKLLTQGEKKRWLYSEYDMRAADTVWETYQNGMIRLRYKNMLRGVMV